MVFNSLAFIVFLGVVLLLYYRFARRGQNLLLVVASYVFYGWWDYRFVALLLFTTFFDYYCALWIEGETRPARRRLLLASSMTVNLAVLCVFKYFNFFAASLQHSFAALGVTLSLPTLYVVLPVGISFYTFLSMSYTIDVYRRELKAARNVTDYMLYVAFFPHLVAGPIVRASFLLPQCQRPRKIIPEEVANGLWLILLGYVKKVVIADRLAQVVAWGFSKGAAPFADANSWLVLYAFAFQIYGDFSGYSDIARGVSKLMGFELPVNFRAPYLVANASSFWRHWHISLSTWLRDYLYIPLGGNRKGRLKSYRNLLITMLLGGLWHGAGAAYVLWGLYHGLLLVVQRAWQELTGRRLSGSNAATSGLERGHSCPQPRSMDETAGELAGPRRLSGLAAESVRAPEPSDVAADRNVRAPTSTATLRFAAPVPWPGWLKGALGVVAFFHLTCLGWLLFRAGSLPASVDQVKFVFAYARTLFILPHHVNPMAQTILLFGAASLFFQWKCDAMNSFSKWPVAAQAVGIIAGLLAIATLGVFEGAQFIYFQF